MLQEEVKNSLGRSSHATIWTQEWATEINHELPEIVK